MSDTTAHTPDFPEYTLPPQARLMHFTIIKVLGQGGFGITYLVRDEHLDCDCVLKENMPRMFSKRNSSTMLVSALTGQDTENGYLWSLQRFKEEAKTLARLNHPNIIRVKDLFDALGTSYYVMEYIDGQELHHATEARRDEATLQHLLRSLLHALQYLHGKGLLHRDIKPSNILVTKQGEPVLIDFGTARSLISEHTHTQLKSQGYTPFEQIQTKGKVGPWTDLYALGATFCRVLTGQCPPDSPDRVYEDDFEPLAERADLKAAYSHALLCSIDKALQPKAKDRWQSAEEWLAALDAETEETTAAPLPTKDKALPAQEPKQGKKADIPHEQAKRIITDTAGQDSDTKLPPLQTDTGNKLRIGILTALALLIVVPTGYMCLNMCLKHKEETGLPPETPQEPTAEICWEKGKECELNERHSEAANWYHKAAEQGYATAQYNLGVMYATGKGVAQDYAEAIKWFRKAAEQGYTDAQCALGYMHEYGEGVVQDDQEAVNWFRKAAEQGDAVAQNKLGFMYQNGKGVAQDDKEAVNWFRKAAEQGNADAQNNLGFMHEFGKGVVQDDQEAVNWFRKAAEQGNDAAQNNLGFMHEFGKGVAQDAKEAVNWYRKAAEQGYATAQCNLGLMYQNGKGVVQDDKEAVNWYRKAAEQGYAEAQCNLALMYATGKGVTQDDQEAANWYRKAAEQGNATAQRALNDMSGKERGSAQDKQEEDNHARKPAVQENARDQYELGIKYRNGWGVKQNDKEAVKWYRKAAEQGFADAQYALGLMYENGWGVSRDIEEAKRWYRKADEQGNQYAYMRLQVLER